MTWTAEEIQFTQENWKSMPKQEIADRLGKKINSVIHFAWKQGWSRLDPANTFEALTEAEKAYIAGIVDGEGHIEIGARLSGTRRIYSISVVVVNTNYELLDWMQRRLPGSYINQRVKRSQAKAHWKPCWTLRVHRRGSVQSLLQNILPYMIVKRGRALEALGAIADIKKSYWR